MGFGFWGLGLWLAGFRNFGLQGLDLGSNVGGLRTWGLGFEAWGVECRPLRDEHLLFRVSNIKFHILIPWNETNLSIRGLQ